MPNTARDDSIFPYQPLRCAGAHRDEAGEAPGQDGIAMHGDAIEHAGELVAMDPAAGADIDIVALYGEHRNHLLRFVQRYVGTREDAEDVVQNTFIEASKCAHRFSGLSKPSTWLFGIALNLARNQVRRNAAGRFEVVEDDFMERLVDPLADPALLYELRQIAHKVEALLEEIPEEIRATFIAVFDGDRTYEQAASDLNIPIGTVRSRVSRVRAAVRNECGTSFAG